MELVLVKSYDGTMVKVPKDKVKEYLNQQTLIKKYLKEGKSIAEIKILLKENTHE